MEKRTVPILLFATFIVCMVAIACSITNKKDDIVLNAQSKEIVDLIYNNRDVWEKKSDGTLCSYNLIQKVDGKLYFVSAYEDYSSREFQLSKNNFVEKSHTDGKGSYGTVRIEVLTMSLPDYDYYMPDEEKYEYVENLVKEMQDPQKWEEIHPR